MSHDKSSKQRRVDLRFDSIDQVLAEVERIASADRAGKLVALGNWTPGEILSHVAAWIEYGYQGYPMKKAPWLLRVILRLGLGRILSKGMSAGMRIPGAQEGTYGMEKMETQAAAQRLQAAFMRLQSGEEASFDSPAFGPMSHDDRIRLNLRHAELHLSHLSY
ncbi:MAG TPA: DUF1569 domain-containing protein [Pirellulaceae bacterium]|nr:DUF1569 domain-containing protein [Pirellulaceae bacterium]